jgi:fumarylacetoacetase
MARLNPTHDSTRRSWVTAANQPDSDFPIQNLPLGIFRRSGETPRGAVAIGDQVLDLAAALEAGLFSGEAAEAARAARGPTLNLLMALGNRFASALRARLSDLLRIDGPERSRVEAVSGRLLVPMAQAELMLPVQVSGFTDFMTSTFHAARGGRIRNPQNPLSPNFKYLPEAYNSRASSVRVSGEPVRRPNGQWKPADAEAPVFGPCRQQDFEMELGMFVGPGNSLGTPIPIEEAPQHIFGFCLLNDWSARDIQVWESQPLGPFLGKSSSTTISPWVVTAEAMAPFRIAAFKREPGDPALLPHLHSEADQNEGGLDLAMEAYILTARMRDRGEPPVRISDTNFRFLYWTWAQMLAHHASNGCNLVPGDLFGSGTVSGPADDSRSCMLELTERGSHAMRLPNGEQRAWLEDGDEIIFRAHAAREGQVRIGFGECRARIDPALAWPPPPNR